MEGVIPPVRENLPGISNPKAVFEVSGTKKYSLVRNGVSEAVARRMTRLGYRTTRPPERDVAVAP